jgi:N-methylhydantoinase A
MSRVPEDGSTVVVAVDTGGTFTDLVVLDAEGRVNTLKVPSTPDDPSKAIVAGLARLFPDGARMILLHGSTVATNALLERRGGDVLLVTTAGFEDVLEIGRQNRPQLYALEPHRPPPLVPAERRVGVRGRLGPGGEEIHPLDRDAVEALIELARDADAVAVVCLHSYANDAHERAIGELLAPAGTPVSLSVDVLPEFREYERTATTVVNAYVQPVMGRYLGMLASELAGDGPLHADRIEVMGSAGGRVPLERAAREPVHTVLSGPAGGVVGAMAWARAVGREGVVTFDMGGTSTDVSLCPGRPLRTREFEIAGLPVAIPVLDIHTVGAGGGSIARVDAGGALRVGPESAGADPGPICYGRGGTDVTVTDAHVWLGRIPAGAFRAGSNELDRNAIEGPLERLADQLGTTPEAAAAGVLEVATTTMERALRVISVERGFDPADLALVAFGGAGALHAAELASRLGCAEALVPPAAGLLSAWGILTAPPIREVSRSVLRSIRHEALPALVEELATAARRSLAEDGVAPAEIDVERWVDARYVGQSFEIRVPADGPTADWAAAFHAAHDRRYGYARPEREVEAVTLRAVARGPARDLVSAETSSGQERANPPTSAHVWLNGEAREVPVVRRSGLAPDAHLVGPHVIVDASETTWVPPGYEILAHASGVLRLRPIPE